MRRQQPPYARQIPAKARQVYCLSGWPPRGFAPREGAFVVPVDADLAAIELGCVAGRHVFVAPGDPGVPLDDARALEILRALSDAGALSVIIWNGQKTAAEWWRNKNDNPGRFEF